MYECKMGDREEERIDKWRENEAAISQCSERRSADSQQHSGQLLSTTAHARTPARTHMHGCTHAYTHAQLHVRTAAQAGASRC